MAPVDQNMYGQFFGGDSYVILYTYLVNNKENFIIYFWQGQVGSCHKSSTRYAVDILCLVKKSLPNQQLLCIQYCDVFQFLRTAFSTFHYKSQELKV